MQESWLGSENAIAGTAARSLRKRPVHSSAKCIASHMLPPLPHDMRRPPSSSVRDASFTKRRTFSTHASSARKAASTCPASSKAARTGSGELTGADDMLSAPMKLLPWAILGGAGVALAVVAWRAPARDYVAPTAAEVQAHAPAPQDLRGDLPAGCVVRTIEVHGMCCTGCTGKLYARLKEAPGFVKGAVSYERGVAEVVARADVDPAPFVEACRFDKYSAELRP